MRALARYDLPMIAKPLLLLGILLAASSALAQQYRWVDEKGRVHYTDTPPPASAKGAEKKNLKGNAVGEQQNTQLAKAIKNGPVTLYTHAECKDPCQVARDVLNRRGVPFREVSVVTPQQQEELKRLSGEITVPVMVVGAYVEKYATAGAFNQALDAAGYPAEGVARAGDQAAPPAPAAPEKPAAKP